MIRFGSDFSGVGAANQALIRLGVEYKEIFACDIDRFARQTFIHNYGEPGYYPEDVYDREIPEESLDLYVTSPPCQSFSMAGNSVVVKMYELIFKELLKKTIKLSKTDNYSTTIKSKNYV